MGLATGILYTPMWFLDRLLARGRRALRPASGSAERASSAVPAYARWLNVELTQLAEALLLATPLAMTSAACDELEFFKRKRLRVGEARQCVHQLLDTARQQQPPFKQDATDDWALAHQEYVSLLERSLAALDCLGEGLATSDEGALRIASVDLGERAAAAADLHARVIEWSLPFLLGPH